MCVYVPVHYSIICSTIIKVLIRITAQLLSLSRCCLHLSLFFQLSFKCFKWLKSLSLYFKFVIIAAMWGEKTLSLAAVSVLLSLLHGKQQGKNCVFESEKTQRRLPEKNLIVVSAREVSLKGWTLATARGSLLLPKCLSLIANVFHIDGDRSPNEYSMNERDCQVCCLISSGKQAAGKDLIEQSQSQASGRRIEFFIHRSLSTLCGGSMM